MEQPYRWYAVCTKSRFEKKLAEKLHGKGIEAYTPVRKTLKQWSDRKKWVDEVLIRSYVFVHITPQQYDAVLNTPGAVRYVWFEGKPAPIPDMQIKLLKTIAGTDTEVMEVPANLPPGTPVRVVAGPLSGLTGELISISGHNRVVVRIDFLDRALSVSIALALVERVTR